MQWICILIFSYLFHDAVIHCKISSLGEREMSFGMPDNPETWTVFLSQQTAWDCSPEDADSLKLSQVHHWSLMISFLSALWPIVLVSTQKGRAWISQENLQTQSHLGDSVWFLKWTCLAYQQIWWEYLDLFLLWFHLWIQQAKRRRRVQSSTQQKDVNSQRYVPRQAQQIKSSWHALFAKSCVAQSTQQNTVTFPHPFKENPRQESWWLCLGATLSSLGGFPKCTIKQWRKPDLVIIRIPYMWNAHVCYQEAVAMTLCSCILKWFKDTLVFLSSSLTTSVLSQPRLSSKIIQLVKGDRRKMFLSYSPSWSRQFNIRQHFKRLYCKRKVFGLTTRKEPLKVNASKQFHTYPYGQQFKAGPSCLWKDKTPHETISVLFQHTAPVAAKKHDFGFPDGEYSTKILLPSCCLPQPFSASSDNIQLARLLLLGWEGQY